MYSIFIFYFLNFNRTIFPSGKPSTYTALFRGTVLRVAPARRDIVSPAALSLQPPNGGPDGPQLVPATTDVRAQLEI